MAADVSGVSDLGAFGPVIGHTAAKSALLDALSSDRLHHGWLFQGPRGVGKLRLAMQFSAALLSDAKAGLSLDAQDPTARLIETGAHPDCRWIQKPVDDKGKMKSEIPVDAARGLSDFFSLRPGMGGWRVAIVDAVDELNRFGANALLKTLEEPPRQALIILIAHGERPVLPTLKSRCRQLRFETLSNEETIKALIQAGVPNDMAQDVAKLAPGRPGRAIHLQSPDAQSAAKSIVQAAIAGPKLDARALNAATAAAAKSDIAFDAAFSALTNWVQQRAVEATAASTAGAWADAHRRVAALAGETKDLNQDKSQAVAQALLALQKIDGTR